MKGKPIVNIFEQLHQRVLKAGISAKDLMDAGIGRSTAYAFIRGELKNYRLDTLTRIETVLNDRLGRP